MATTTPDPGPKMGAARRKRTAPERTAPVRNMTAMLRAKGAAKGGSPEAGAAREAASARVPVSAKETVAARVPVTPPAAESPEDRAVRAGYELCEAAIRRGQDAARRLGPGMADMTGGLKDVPGAREALGMAEGAFRAWAELATAWMRAVLPLAPAGFPDPLHILESLRAAVAGGAGSNANAGASNANANANVSANANANINAGTSSDGMADAGRKRAVSFAVEVMSARPTRIAFELSREVDIAALAVQPLQPLQPLDRDPGKLAILGVEILPGKDGWSIAIRVSISEAQPAGRYLGAVYDKHSGAFVGGLTVDLQG